MIEPGLWVFMAIAMFLFGVAVGLTGRTTERHRRDRMYYPGDLKP